MGICTRMEESICARQRDLWGTSIFSRASMRDKTRNKIKPESKKIPKTTPPTPLGKVQKKNIRQTSTLHYSSLMQGQWNCRTSCSYYVTWYETLQVSSSAIFIRNDFSSCRKHFFSQNYWGITDTVFLVLWTFRCEARNFGFKARGVVIQTRKSESYWLSHVFMTHVQPECPYNQSPWYSGLDLIIQYFRSGRETLGRFCFCPVSDQ